ncbi:hypothetical protein VTI28DRAFT_9012 [Corynascus sepedonium]
MYLGDVGKLRKGVDQRVTARTCKAQRVLWTSMRNERAKKRSGKSNEAETSHPTSSGNWFQNRGNGFELSSVQSVEEQARRVLSVALVDNFSKKKHTCEMQGICVFRLERGAKSRRADWLREGVGSTPDSSIPTAAGVFKSPVITALRVVCHGRLLGSALPLCSKVLQCVVIGGGYAGLQLGLGTIARPSTSNLARARPALGRVGKLCSPRERG